MTTESIGGILLNIYGEAIPYSTLVALGITAFEWWRKVVGRTERQWIELGKNRIFNILHKRRVSYSRHLEIKISEAGPSRSAKSLGQRVEPVLLSMALRELKRNGQVGVYKHPDFEIIQAPDFGKRGDSSKQAKLIRLHDLFLKCSSRHEEFCGLMLEKLLYDTVLNNCRDHFQILGSGPLYNDKGLLYKPSGSEIIFIDGKTAYGNAGFDLFLIHKSSQISVGVEAKNIREWIYPAAVEVWRTIARACTLECLPVLAARKFSYITRPGFFSYVGILGFETQFQYFHPAVRAFSKYQFSDIVDKDGLGFADIKITTDVPGHFIRFFNNILPNQVEEYYERFMKHRDILMKYAIEHKLAEDIYSNRDRIRIYKEFQQEIGFTDPDFED